jgi:uncharacterized protein YciI
MQFALIAYDKPDGLAARMAARPDHLEHLKALGEHLLLAGPFLDAAGNMNGSIMVVEATDRAEAETLFGRDPFITRGVFATYEIHLWRAAINNLPK